MDSDTESIENELEEIELRPNLQQLLLESTGRMVKKKMPLEPFCK